MVETLEAAPVLPATPVVLPSQIPSVRLDFLEGLRALAALWVVMSHLWIAQCGPNAHTGWIGWATNPLLYSHLAVDVFIVLSGFCLAWSIRRDQTLPPGGSWAFWKRRARRLLPACYLALLFAVGIAMGLGRVHSGTWHLDGHALAINIFLLQDLFLKSNVYDGPMWSIAVEWRLSLLFPVLVWLWRSGGPGLMLTVAGVIGYAVTTLIFRYEPQFLLSCPWYLLLFALGMCAAWSPAKVSVGGHDRHNLGWVIVAGISLPALVFLLHAFPITSQGGNDFGQHMPLIDLPTGLLSAALLVGLRGLGERAIAVRVLSWRPLARLGQFSYSLYLTHVPLLIVLGDVMHHQAAFAALPAAQRALVMSLFLPVLVGMAYLFYLGCERPFIAKRPR